MNEDKNYYPGGITIDCVSCHNTFFLTDSEQDYYKRMDFPFPKRCPDCRKKKKKAYDTNDTNPQKEQARRRFNQKKHSRSYYDK